MISWNNYGIDFDRNGWYDANNRFATIHGASVAMSQPMPTLLEVKGPTHYRGEDPTDSRFYIKSTLMGGVLTFEIVAKLVNQQRGIFSGKQLFKAMIDHFGASTIATLKAIWTDDAGLDTNIDEFNLWTGPPHSLSKEVAATKTWTGQRATIDLGLVTVNVVDSRGTPDDTQTW